MKQIKIEYEIFGAMKSRFRGNTGTVTVPEAMTLREFLVEKAGLEHGHLKFLDVTADGAGLSLDSELKEGMKVKILMPIGGG
jgi:sulfur carrier protein ThiS